MKKITADQLKGWMDRDEEFLLVDTLDEEHFTETRLPYAVNIPQAKDDFVQKVEEQAGSKEMPIVVYCASASCDSSSTAAQKLEDAGFTNVHDFEAGAKGWQEAGQVLVTS